MGVVVVLKAADENGHDYGHDYVRVRHAYPNYVFLVRP